MTISSFIEFVVLSNEMSTRSTSTHRVCGESQLSENKRVTGSMLCQWPTFYTEMLLSIKWKKYSTVGSPGGGVRF